MTLLDERPTATEPSRPSEMRRSAASTWRFAARLARREVRRRPARTMLAALLIAVPVAAMTTGSLIARTNAGDWAADFQRDYGDADIVIGRSAMPVGVTDALVDGAITDDPLALPGGATVLGSYLMTSTSFTPADGRPGEVIWGNFTDIDFTNPAESHGIEVVAGRAPRVGEVLLARDIADRLGIGIGDTLRLDRPSGEWVVAGFGRMRGNYWHDLVAIPGFDLERITPEDRYESVLLQMPPGTSPADIVRAARDHDGITRYEAPWYDESRLATGMAWGYVAGVLALVAVGIIVAAAFATSARRQLVTIGQLASNGAPEQVVHRTLFLQGSWTGAVGGAVGVVGGFAALPLVIPLVERHLLQHELRSLRVSWMDLVVIAATAIVAATIAAAVPARSASRVPVMAALAGRRPAGTPPRWLVPTGVVLFLGGLGLVAVAALGAEGGNAGNNTWAALVVLGATSMVFGVCCASPLVVARVGGFGRRSPLAWRLAMRSLARSRTRSAAVIAAIAVAVGGAVALAAVAEQTLRADALCCPASIPADTVVIQSYEPGSSQVGDGSGLIDLDAVDGFDPPAPLRDYLADVDADRSPLLGATFDPAPFDSQYDYIEPLGPLIATPELLDVMDMSRANRDVLATEGVLSTYFDHNYAIESGTPFALASDWEFRAETGTITFAAPPPVEPVPYPLNGSLLMTESAARDAGFAVTEIGLVLRFDSPLTQDDLERLRDVESTVFGGWHDAFVEPGDPDRSEFVDPGVSIHYDDPSWRAVNDRDLWIARLLIVAVALTLSLLVVSIGLALAAAEGRDERDAFVIVGARPSSMRRLTAARAAVVALVGIVLGLPLGFLPVWVVDRVTDEQYAANHVAVRFPWLVVATLVVVIPTVAAGGAWVATGLARRFRPPSPTHRD